VKNGGIMVLDITKSDYFGALDRWQIEVPDRIFGNPDAIARRVKDLVGWRRLKTVVVDYGDCRLSIKPRGVSQSVHVRLHF
jgi:hypothetical protein